MLRSPDAQGTSISIHRLRVRRTKRFPTKGAPMSEPMNRRDFVTASAAAAVLADQAVAQRAAVQPGPGDPKKDRIVRLDLLTSREVGDWKRKGGDVIFVPHGPISGHGP